MNKNIQIGVVAAVVAVVVSLLLSFTGVGKSVGGVYSSEQTFAGGIRAAYTKVFPGKTLTASTTLTTSDLEHGNFFPVGLASADIHIKLPAVPSDMVGREVIFGTTVASTTISVDSNSTLMGVVTMSVNSTLSTPEDIGDYVKCIFISTAKATCLINAKD